MFIKPTDSICPINSNVPTTAAPAPVHQCHGQQWLAEVRPRHGRHTDAVGRLRGQVPQRRLRNVPERSLPRRRPDRVDEHREPQRVEAMPAGERRAAADRLLLRRIGGDRRSVRQP